MNSPIRQFLTLKILLRRCTFWKCWYSIERIFWFFMAPFSRKVLPTKVNQVSYPTMPDTSKNLCINDAHKTYATKFHNEQNRKVRTVKFVCRNKNLFTSYWYSLKLLGRNEMFHFHKKTFGQSQKYVIKLKLICSHMLQKLFLVMLTLLNLVQLVILYLLLKEQ